MMIRKDFQLSNHTPQKRVQLARDPKRLKVKDYINALFEGFFETHGDRLYGDDRSLICGIAKFNHITVTVAGNVKANSLEENVKVNFGMANPEGYRKFQRAITQAEKFSRPIITFIDTPGAYPGMGAEERGQGEAIAKCLYMLSRAKVPIISVFTGEGGSGGALAIGLSDKIIMLENAIFSVLSPEGFASILWKDSKRSTEASELMKLTSEDLLDYGIADYVIKEPESGVSQNPSFVFKQLSIVISDELSQLRDLKSETLVKLRHEKYRRIGIL
jgi:acetyl-CoA carboxylase carboxyl transferase subunit alpha